MGIAGVKLLALAVVYLWGMVTGRDCERGCDPVYNIVWSAAAFVTALTFVVLL